MALNASSVKSLSVSLNEKLKGEYLQGFNEFDQDSFFWSLSNKEKLVFSLAHGFPRVYIGGKDLTQSSLNTAFSSSIRKLLSHAKILEVRSFDNERIMTFALERTNEVYKKENVTLVFEMIPAKPRLLLLDEDKKIIISTNYSPLESKRPLLRGLTYALPEKGNYVPKEEVFDYDLYLAKCLEEENKIKESRKKNRFAPYIKTLKTKAKTAQRKIKAIEEDIKEANEHINDSIYGDYIYTEFSSFHKGDESFVYEGKTIKLDPRKSPQENAASFYKRAKKAKATLEQSKLHLEKAKQEEENALTLLEMIDTLDGAALEEIGPSLGILPSPKHKEIEGTGLLPFQVKEGDTRILFGKNSKQNDFLSFLYVNDKDALWFHVAKGPGSHAILLKDKPSKEDISLACEIALLASSLDGGEIMYTERRNIKRGSYVGQAIVKTYQSAYFSKISEKAKALYETAEKVSLSNKK